MEDKYRVSKDEHIELCVSVFKNPTHPDNLKVSFDFKRSNCISKFGLHSGFIFEGPITLSRWRCMLEKVARGLDDCVKDNT